MSGVKGRSGRLCGEERARRERVIQKAWMKAEKTLDGTDCSAQAATIVNNIINKTLPDEINANIESNQLVIMKYAKD